MFKPSELQDEEVRLRKLLQQSVSLLEEAVSSTYWSYTREYQAGKLDVAKDILWAVLEDLEDQ